MSLRDRLAAEIGPEYGLALEILARVRTRLREQHRSIAERRRILRGLAEGGLVDRVRAKDRGGIEALLRSVGGEPLDALGVDFG